METQQQLSPGKFGVNYGLVLGIIMVLISVIAYITGLQLSGAQWPTYIYYLIFLIGVFYAVSQYKKNNGNYLKLGEAVKVGLVIGVISAIVFCIYYIVFVFVIDPGFSAQMMEITREKMLENPNMTEEMVDQQMAYVEMFAGPWIFTAFWLAISTFFGLIYSLIAGLIMKKEVNQY